MGDTLSRPVVDKVSESLENEILKVCRELKDSRNI